MYQEIEFVKFMHHEIGFHNNLMNTYDIATNTIIPYASITKPAKDDEKLVNLNNLQCDLAYADELRIELAQRQLAIQTELLIQIITSIKLVIKTKET